MLICDPKVVLGSRPEALFALQSSELQVALRHGELSRCAAHRAAPVRFEHGELDPFEMFVESALCASEPETRDEET